jgi:hypothetical protein
MPDVWTKHPDVVRDLLKEGGFTCGVAGRFLPGRDPAWTCILDGANMRGDLYIHHADRLRSELQPGDDSAFHAAALGDIGDWGAPALALLLGVVIARWLPKRARRR